ncbi:Pr6Pr family membrane protein [Leekyejoonella antrihumi]|uniref:F420-dependent oxidoreductase n=1 Tax=Leekyejoonella antrihumi TaxID=1660198 RepID=A0A563E5B9_9MICO|nr:Pr6Pr family membrane protein [Leekyejoonella antrihumi]TWP37706.1 hypothetical protein FGL98_05800 [Leekyejoonella antrihumi]
MGISLNSAHAHRRTSPGLMRFARAWHGLVTAVAAFAIVFQLILVIRGSDVLTSAEPPGSGERLIRFFSYFTILSNLLVLYTSATLTANPSRSGRVWNVLRLDAITGIVVTGVVHWFFLRPLLRLSGGPLVADKLLHVVVPVLAVVGWLVFGPRLRIGWGTVLPSLIYPLAWIAYTLLRGAATGWYPYPFVNVRTHGYGVVTVNCIGIAALLLAISVLLLHADRWLVRAGLARVSRQSP